MSKLQLPIDSNLLSEKFLFGVATSSFQIEGDSEGRNESIWDVFCRKDGAIADQSNGHLACNHINLWQGDVNLLSELGVDAYRLSLSWPRLVDADGSLRADGIAFYDNLIDALLARGIKPFVTFYHWDLPQYLEDKGGWLNRSTAYAFRDYVEKVSAVLGDRVYAYATLNEPFCSAYLGYENGTHAPGRTGQANGRNAAHHLLLAHGLAMQVLNKSCPNSHNGIVLNFTPCYPESDSEQDVQATRYADEYINQWYLKPVMEGRYPDIINLIPEANRPDIQDGDMAIINTAIDYLGVNYYTRLKYRASKDGLYEEIQPQDVTVTDMGWEVYPSGLTELLVSLNKQYRLPPIYITENGAATADQIENERIDDIERLDYLNAHLNAVHNACAQGVDIRGYFAWSLMDNFEWAEGYLKRFGLVYVDYDTQKRTIKNSGLAYGDLLKSRRI